MLESWQFTTVTELEEHEKFGFSYMMLVLRLSLLAPEIVEAILEGRRVPRVTLARFLEPFSAEWSAHILQLRGDPLHLYSPG
jgi:hypothetical protein